MIEWHRLIGLGLIDYFTDSCYKIEMEKDLSIKKQRLDILIIEQESGRQISELPDGLENLARHNLITFKSLHKPLDAWALDELIGHYVNYRKQSSPSSEKLLPIEDFALYAIATRHPEKLETKAALELVKKGVYDIDWGSRRIRLIVLSEVPKVKRNALWLLFSGMEDSVQYGALQYEWRQPELSTVINDLLEFYHVRSIAMSYTVEDYKRERKEKKMTDWTHEELIKSLTLEEILKKLSLSQEELLERLSLKEILKKLPPEELLERLSLKEILKKLPPEERLKGLPPEERLKGLPPEERLKGLPPEERLKGLPPEEFLKRLTREEIEAYLKKLSTSN